MLYSEEKINQEIGERLKLLLKAEGRTQAWLARNAFISPAAVSKWVNGSGMSKENAMICADLLHTTPAFILGLSENDKKRKLLESKKEKIMDVVLMSYILQDAPMPNMPNTKVLVTRKKKENRSIGYLKKHDIDMLCNGLLDMVNVYVDHFIEQHRAYVEPLNKDIE